MNVSIKGYGGEPIRSFGDWESYALPRDRHKKHWAEGRSAYELGLSWTASGAPSVPPELTDLLESNEKTRRITILEGRTEHETALPFGARGPRCHDLALVGRQGSQGVSIYIEAKADESFGGSVAEELSKTRKRVTEKKQTQTRFPNRLDWLTRSLLGFPAFKNEGMTAISDSVANLPYQLLAAIAGTLIEAKLQNAAIAIFVVHEFRTQKTGDHKMAENGQVMANFLRLLIAQNMGIEEHLEFHPGHLLGPLLFRDFGVTEPVRFPYDVPLFVGKIRTDKRLP
jgi:hypothetical protein